MKKILFFSFLPLIYINLTIFLDAMPQALILCLLLFYMLCVVNVYFQAISLGWSCRITIIKIIIIIKFSITKMYIVKVHNIGKNVTILGSVSGKTISSVENTAPSSFSSILFVTNHQKQILMLAYKHQQLYHSFLGSYIYHSNILP